MEKCTQCGRELAEGKLYCEHCGMEIKIVPDFEPEIENSIQESLNSLAEGIIQDNLEQENFDKGFEKIHFLSKLWSQINHNRVLATVIIAAFTLLVCVAVFFGIRTYQYNSYNYQVSSAFKYAEMKNYSQAVSYMERAMEIDPMDQDALLLLADYYYRNQQKENAILLLLDMTVSDNSLIEAYGKLISIYEKDEEYTKINELLLQCSDSQVLEKYQAYVALEPAFNVEEGVYDEMIPLKLSGNTTGTIYYTLDLSDPLQSGHIYTAPIFLESGKHTVKAVFMNQFGIVSKQVEKTYTVNAVAPYPPEVSLYSGSYEMPRMISVEIPQDCSIYYTTNGTTPTRDSNLYSVPLPMPLKQTTFKFIAMGDTNLPSEVVERTYNLSITPNVSAELAVNNLVQTLYESGMIENLDGKPNGMVGTNLYLCDSAIAYGGETYYLVIEHYTDSAGVQFKTGSQYAVNINSGNVYKAIWKENSYYEIVPMV